MQSPNKPLIVAEIGCNHKGNMRIAKEMIKIAALYCQVDVVKFQKRTPKELLSPKEYASPHPNPIHSYGKTYGEHREFLELSQDQHLELLETCREWGVQYSTSVWDVTSAEQICSFRPPHIKIPSACNLNFKLLEYVVNHYEGDIHLSFGMTRIDEEERILQFFTDHKRNKDLIIYSCVSGYPVPHKDLSLLDIQRLKNRYGDMVKGIGFSGHHLGIAPDIAALALGATYFERHYTLDRNWKGTDHAASLEPEALGQLVKDLQSVSEALSYKQEEILDIEKAQRKKLKRSLYE